MKKRIFSSTIVVSVIVLAFASRLITPYIFDAIMCILAIMGTYEVSKVFKNANKPNYVSFALAFPVVMYIGLLIGLHYQRNYIFYFAYFLILFIALIIAIFIVGLFDKNNKNLENNNQNQKNSITKIAFNKAMNTAYLFIYPSLFFFSLLLLNHLPDIASFATAFAKYKGFDIFITFMLLFVFVVTTMTDTFALLVGMFIGGRKLCPKISANKTFAGAGGGLFFGTLLGYFLYLIFATNSNFMTFFTSIGGKREYIILIAIAGSIFTQLGDIWASFLKRKGNVKDFGNLLPGHGGVMDRVDGLIVTSFITTFITIMLLI